MSRIRIKKFFTKALQFIPKSICLRICRRMIRVPDLPFPVSFEIARSKEDLDMAFSLLYQSYLKENITMPTSSKRRVTCYHCLPSTVTLIAKQAGEVIATVSVIRDGVFGLPADNLMDLERFRVPGKRIAEVSSLAIREEWQGKSGAVMFYLTKYMFKYSKAYFGVDRFIIAVHPQRILLYEGIFLFTLLHPKAIKGYGFANNAPAVIATLDLEHAEDRFRQVYDQAPAHRNLYQFFVKTFSEKEKQCMEFPEYKDASIPDPLMTPDVLEYLLDTLASGPHALTNRQIRQLMLVYGHCEYKKVLLPQENRESQPDNLEQPDMKCYGLDCPDPGKEKIKMRSASAILKEVKQFETFKKYIWPFMRRLVRKHLTPRCRKCFLPQTYSPLDQQGFCVYCRQGEQVQNEISKEEQARLQARFDEMMTTAATQKTVRFHALVLFSGGKDSSYLLHYLTTRYKGLRILALTVDNTFMSPVAMENVKDIVRSVGVDHMVFRPVAGMMEKMFRHAFTHLNENGCAGTVDQFDGDFFSDTARNIAAAMGIPYILCGLSRDQVKNILNLDTFATSQKSEARRRDTVAGITLTDIFDEHEMKYWWDGSAWPAEKRPRMLFPFYIWNFEESYIKRRVLELNLMPRGDESPLVTNNSLIPLMGIVDMLKFGYSSFEPEFARMVRNGKSDRIDWLYTFETLEYAARTGRLLGQSIDIALERLSLTRKDFGIKGEK